MNGPEEQDRREAVQEASFLIVARGSNGVIGNGAAIPWRHRADMVHFRNATLGCALIVGRTTYDTLPANMPGRTIVVVTSRPLPEGADAIAADGIGRAVELAIEAGVRAIAFAGGPRIYAEALSLDWLTTAMITEIDAAPDGDAVMPELGHGWSAISDVPLVSREGEPAARVVTYRRMHR